jgi:hypothetical protein
MELGASGTDWEVTVTTLRRYWFCTFQRLGNAISLLAVPVECCVKSPKVALFDPILGTDLAVELVGTFLSYF